MRALVVALLLSTAVLAPRAEATLPDQPIARMEHQIEALEARQEAAWNAHDNIAYAALFADDADVVNVLGWHWRGRAELRDKLGRAFATVFSRSVLHVGTVSVRPVAPNVAVALVEWTMTGALSPDGSGGNVPQRGIQTQVLTRGPAGWTIVAFQNTNAVPERPFGTR